jgi:hypothetical protein
MAHFRPIQIMAITTSDRGPSSSVPSHPSSSLVATMARGWVEGIKWLGRLMSCISGMLLYTFISSYNRFKIFSVHVNIKD